MRYTVCNRGRPIGITDLGFPRFDGYSRAGWFHPNHEGERVVPLITSIHSALLAYARRSRAEGGGSGHDRSELRASTAYADVAEALQHSEALELTLHFEDGTIVPTELIGLQDMEQLIAATHEEEFLDDPCDTLPPFDDPDVEAAVEHDLQIIMGDDWWNDAPQDDPWDDVESWAAGDVADGWSPDDEPTVFPRYQIIVRLAYNDAIP